jgi:hypothetical protein
MFVQCKNDHLIKNYKPISLENDNIPYDQQDKDVVEIVRASEEIYRMFHAIIQKLALTGATKNLPEIWNAFSKKIRYCLQRKLFMDFKSFVEGARSNQDGKEFAHLILSDLYKSILKICSEVTREKLYHFHRFAVVIDGEEISTRLEETYMIPVNLPPKSF